jgi:hypothetical protein
MTTGSPPINSQTQVPSLNLTLDPTVSTVNTIANERLSPPLSPTSAQLRNNEQAKDQLLQKVIDACRLIDSNPEQARTLFVELIKDMPKTATLLFLADCKLGLAYTYPADSEDRTQAAILAKTDLDRVYENRSAWDSLNAEEKVNRYKYLRVCLKDFEILVQDDMSSLENSVELQIEECSRHIPLLSDFYDKLNEDAHLQENEAKREVFNQALEMIEGHEEPDYLLARAFGTTSLALTCKPGDENPFSLTALAQAIIAYQKKEALFTSDQAKLTTLNLFDKLFHNLIQLFSDSETLVAINRMFEECREELALLEGSVPKDKNSPRKVSKEPVDSWKTARLIIAFGFAAIVIASAFVLGRRYVSLSK